MSRPKVLCVSFDETVSRMRMAALRDSGYDVTALTVPREVLEMQPAAPFDLVVIGHRFDLKNKEAMIKKAREWKAQVILVCGDSNDPELHPDKRVYALEGTSGMVEMVQKLVPIPELKK